MWLETQRLILREFEHKDLCQLAPILANPEVMKFSPTGVLSVQETQRRIDYFIALYKKYGFGKWAVILKQSNKLIGYCGITVDEIDGVDERELGYRLDREFWGRGLATEAASMVVKYAFEKLKFPYILGIVQPENTASVRVLEKLGMEYKKQTVFYGYKVDVYQLSRTL